MFDGKLCAMAIAGCIFLASAGAFCTDYTNGNDDNTMIHYLLCGVVTMGALVELLVVLCWTP